MRDRTLIRAGLAIVGGRGQGGVRNSFIKFKGILTLHSHKCSIKKQRSFLWVGEDHRVLFTAVKGPLL